MGPFEERALHFHRSLCPLGLRVSEVAIYGDSFIQRSLTSPARTGPERANRRGEENIPILLGAKRYWIPDARYRIKQKKSIIIQNPVTNIQYLVQSSFPTRFREIMTFLRKNSFLRD